MRVRRLPLEQLFPMQELQVYIGIADNNGLESFFIPGSSDQLHILLHRTRLNSHRNATVYRTFIEAHHANKILQYMKESKCKQALIYLKKWSKEIELPKGLTYESWEAIPTLTQKEFSEIEKENDEAYLKKKEAILRNMDQQSFNFE